MLLFWAMRAIMAGYAQPAFSFVLTSETVSEGIGTYSIAVFPTGADTKPDSVDINVVGGNAAFGTNFTYSPVTLVFPPNQTFEQLFTVTVIDDSIEDGTKSVVFKLTNPTGGTTIGTNAFDTLIMTDVDTPIISLTSNGVQASEDTGNVNVGVNLNRGVRGTTTVQVNLLPDGTTAVEGVDFIFNDTTLVWPADSDGVLNAVIGVINNSFYEHSRTVEVGITTATNGGIVEDTTFTLTILANSNDSLPGCSNLFFGQYVEGSGSNKALQIYNPTAVPINLGVYSIVESVNGGATMTAYNLSGTIAPQGVYVIANPNASTGILSVANATSSFINFDGTDALALLHLTDTIDIIGQLYVNSGSDGWAVGAGSTVQQTLIRNYYDHAGDTSWANAQLTWNVYPVDMIDSLGFHRSESCSGGVPVATVRFLRSSDTIEQVDTSVNWIIAEVNNPTGGTVFYVMAFDPNTSTAVDGVDENGITDFHYSNRGYFAPPGLSYDTVLYFDIFTNALITPPKTVFFRLINLSSNLVAIPDSTYTLYLINHNKFIVSFLGAGYSYPKGSGLVEIPVVTSTFSSQLTTVDITLSIGDAILGQDFLFDDTTVTFPAFSTDTQGVWVTILNNNVYEVNKQANFNLSNATNGAILGISGFTLTIINNDSLAGGTADVSIDNNLKVFPNPVSDNLLIQTDQVLSNVELTDVLGNRIANLGLFQKGTSNIDVSSLPSGIYFLNIMQGDQIYSRRFLKTE
jgi:hypothetical protein